MLKYWKEYFLTLSDRQWMLLLFIVALIIRTVGINYGYWHGDERIGDAAKALGGQLVPGQHFYPPLLNYINAVFLGFLYALGRLVPVWYSVDDFRQHYFADPTAFYLTARAVTAAMSAATAPLFFAIAKTLTLSKRQCILAGVWGILIPVMVLLSHISKSDVPLASSAILVIFLMIKKYENLTDKKTYWDAAIGGALALTMSFKHSYIFILFPMMVAHGFYLWKIKDFLSAFKSISAALAVFIPVWCVFNIGILLDFSNFIEFQKIQSEMSVHENVSYIAASVVWFKLASSLTEGVNGIVVILFFAFPFAIKQKNSLLPYKDILSICWASILIGMVIIIVISGTRQHAGLWVPYFTCMQLFACLCALELFQRFSSVLKTLSLIVNVVALGLSCIGTVIIWKQSLAQPISGKVAHYVSQNYASQKVATTFALDIPQQKEAQAAEFARHDRLAEKYNVTMPERAEERYIIQSAPGAVYYINLPAGMFGLETADENDPNYVVKPYAWPLQKEEWQLDHWLTQGFSIFVIADYDYYRNETPSKVFRAFYTELGDRCAKVKEFLPEKSLFLEATVTVFECRALNVE